MLKKIELPFEVWHNVQEYCHVRSLNISEGLQQLLKLGFKLDKLLETEKRVLVAVGQDEKTMRYHWLILKDGAGR
jgi:hypothetical protein